MSCNSSEQQELKHIASIVRALVTSRKPPCFMKDVLREYQEVESRPIPFRSLGCKTAQELLERTGEFIFQGNRGTGDAVITAKFNHKSAHIASLVRGQKPSKSTRQNLARAVRHPHRMSMNRSYASGDRNNNHFNRQHNISGHNYLQHNQQRLHQTQQQQYSNQLQRQKSVASSGSSQPKDLRDMLNAKKNQKIQQQLTDQNKQLQSEKKQQHQVHQNQNMLKQQAPPRAILGANSNPTPNHLESTNNKINFKTEPQTTKPPQSSQNSFTKQASTTEQTDKQPMNSVGQKAEQRLNMNDRTQHIAAEPVKSKTLNQTQISSASLSNLAARLQFQQQLKLQQNQQNQQNQQMQQRLQPAPQLHQKQEQQSHKIIPPQALTKAREPATPMGAAGLQTRLNVYTTKPEKPNPTPISPIQYSPKIECSSQSDHPPIDSIASLLQFCKSKNYAPPRFTCIKNKFIKGTYTCTCRVDVNGAIFSTYPTEYETEHEAKVQCAARALENITKQENKRPLPPCLFSDTEFLDKLYTELLNHSHGIFAKNFPDLFEKIFQLTPPDNWFALVQTSSLFTTEMSMNKMIIFANKDADTDITPLTPNDKAKVLQIDPIRLPWTLDYWCIHITHCSSTVEVWGRLFGNDYNGRFEALIKYIDAFMSTKKERPLAITRNNIYLVCINECWHRVRVEELDKSKGSAKCFFIDYGDAEWLSVDQLFICATHFLTLPAQAVPFSLYGLEDFEGNPFARKCLDDLLSSKSVVGKIFTRESEFYDTSSKFHGKIQVVFFDTSTPEDINLNDQLSDTICEKSATPVLWQTTVTNVIVTHVSDQGDIFLQIKSPEMKYIQTLLLQIVENKLQKDQHMISYDDLKRSKMFLVCDDSDANHIKWYRASMADVKVDMPQSGKHQMYLIDYGMNKLVERTKIYLLESLSMALSKFPALATKVHLHNIPDITKNIIGRMRGLLPNGCDALTKLVVRGPVPLVTIYTRLEGPDSFCTINDVIRIEHELEGCWGMLSGSFTDDANTSSKSTLDFAKDQKHNASSSSLASPSTPTSNSFIDVTKGLTLTTVPGSPQKVNDLPNLSNFEDLPKIGQYLEVRVTMSANPANFTIQPFKHYPELMGLMKDLQEFCATNDEFIPSDMVLVGQAFAAKNPDGYFHRVTVVKKIGDMIHVSFCDFGDIAIVESSQLKILPLKFRKLPKMAIQAKLHGIKAKNGDWTLEDCLFFRKLTVGQNLGSLIKNITNDKSGMQILELELIDVTTEEDVYITEILVNENIAVKDN